MSAYHKNALPPGYELAEYTIQSVLGHGGFGITYLARDSSLNALVAIKEYLPHDLAARGGDMAIVPDLDSKGAVRDYHWGLKRFLKEARALAQFKHPNIVRVLRFIEANETAYMVMEYEKGESLGQFLRHNRNRLDEKELLRIFLPILNGLDAVHQAGLVHFDIKPDNIYIRSDGSPMLIDFGSARQAMRGHGMAKRVVLTPGYAPIEQYPDKGQPGDWTDVYAIGASMYRCIGGKRPTESLERYQMILKYSADPLTPATKIGQGRYQPQLLECVDWALQPYPTDRPRSARELQDAMMGKTDLIKKPNLIIKKRGMTGPMFSGGRRGFVGRALKMLMVLLFFAATAAAGLYYFWPTVKKDWPELAHQAEQWIPKDLKLPEWIGK